MALSRSEPAKLTEIARSCGQAIPVDVIPYLCILAIKYDEQTIPTEGVSHIIELCKNQYF